MSRRRSASRSVASPAPAAGPGAGGGRVWWAAAALVLAVLVAWAPSLPAPFQLDDHASIVTNETLRGGSLTDWLRPPSIGGETVSGRPLLNLSFALNYAAGGLDPRGYRAVNLVLHLINAGLLFGLLRRTWERGAPALPGQARERALVLAFAVALLWAVHPLQTAAVTYVVQRAEVLAAGFILLALYGFVRGVARDHPRPGWLAVAVVATWLGAATKETAVIVPVLVLGYDRLFVAGTFRAAWTERRAFYVGLVASWLLIAGLAWATGGRGGSAGWGGGPGAWSYLVTQAAAITRYAVLAGWPAGQVFDYGTPLARFGDVWPLMLVLALLGLLAGWAYVRRRPAGFAALSFFLLLAPSSSFVPIATQTMAEHRMYLPLAALLTMGVAGAARLARGQLNLRWLAAVLLVALALGSTTWTRNLIYRDGATLWRDTVEKRPDNPRAWNNLGLALKDAGRTDEAARAYARAIKLNPAHAFAHHNLGVLHLQAERWDEAARHFAAAVEAAPDHVDARINLAVALDALGRRAEAIPHIEEALRREPTAVEVRARLDDWRRADEAGPVEALLAEGNAAARAGRFDQAIEAFERVLDFDPQHRRARNNLANCQLALGRFAAAVANYEAVRTQEPDNEAVIQNLAVARELWRQHGGRE